MNRITEITNREKEIYDLRQAGWSFTKIAKEYRLSPTTVSAHYRHVLRKQSELKMRQFREIQNKQEVSVTMTLGEAVILQRILSGYVWSAIKQESARLKNKHVIELQKEDIDFIIAQKLFSQLQEIEEHTRLQSQR